MACSLFETATYITTQQRVYIEQARHIRETHPDANGWTVSKPYKASLSLGTRAVVKLHVEPVNIGHQPEW